MSVGSGPVSPKSCGGRSSNGSSPCGKRSARSPRCRRSMPTSGSGPSPRLSSRRTSSSSRRTATCARRHSRASARTSGRTSASSRSREFSTPLCAADAIGVAREPHGETRVDGRRDLCEGPESGTSVLHQEDRAEGAIVDAQVGLSGPGATKGGEDAALTPWQPVPEWGQEMYESRLKMIGGVTGIGFITNDLKRTIADLTKRGVKTAVDRESETFGRFTDPDGNVVFLAQPAKPKVRRAGVSLLGFVTVASRDSKKTGEFFRKALGMRKQRADSDEEGFDSYQLSPKATAITPFTPRKEMYDNPADYDADMAHVGEETGIGLTTSDIYRLQEQLLAKGVRFKEKAEAQDWGGIRARFFDPDDNVYTLVEYKA